MDMMALGQFKSGAEVRFQKLPGVNRDSSHRK
jgi:hypothetical protein